MAVSRASQAEPPTSNFILRYEKIGGPCVCFGAPTLKKQAIFVDSTLLKEKSVASGPLLSANSLGAAAVVFVLSFLAGGSGRFPQGEEHKRCQGEAQKFRHTFGPAFPVPWAGRLRSIDWPVEKGAGSRQSAVTRESPPPLAFFHSR